MKSLKFITIAFVAAFLLTMAVTVLHAQDTMPAMDTALHDTAGKIPAIVKDTAVAPAPGPILPSNHIGNFPLPAWLQTAMIAMSLLVPFLQFVLKRIPTAYSVKLGGWPGRILDFLTFFQPDRSLNGGEHKS